jgi:hypothetical protein
MYGQHTTTFHMGSQHTPLVRSHHTTAFRTDSQHTTASVRTVSTNQYVRSAHYNIPYGHSAHTTTYGRHTTTFRTDNQHITTFRTDSQHTTAFPTDSQHTTTFRTDIQHTKTFPTDSQHTTASLRTVSTLQQPPTNSTVTVYDAPFVYTVVHLIHDGRADLFNTFNNYHFTDVSDDIRVKADYN